MKSTSREYIYRARNADEVSVVLERFESDAGATVDHVHVESPYEVVFVAGLREPAEVILLRQYRPIAQEVLWELPAGSPEPGESLAEGAAREFAEETGFQVHGLVHLASFYASIGMTDQRGHVFVGRVGEASGAPPTAPEILEVHSVPLAEAVAMVHRGEIVNLGSAHGLLLADQWLRDSGDLPPLTAVIPAAGVGRRMEEAFPGIAKALLPVAGQPMIRWLLEALDEARVASQVVVVVGPAVEGQLRGSLADADVRYAFQPVPRGTADAVRSALPAISPDSEVVLVLLADHPLLSARTIRHLVDRHLERRPVLTMLTVELDDFADWRSPFYDWGRVLRDERGGVAGVVEARDASEEELAITEVNPSVYCFDAAWLSEHLPQIGSDNAQREYLLTDIVGIATRLGYPIETVPVGDPQETMGANTPEHLAVLDDVHRRLRAAPARFPSTKGATMGWEELSGGDRTIYGVVINHEEQYSLWPIDAPPRRGWTEVGFQGPRAEAQAYIEEVWTDMRPLSLRKALAKFGSVDDISEEVWTDMRP